jgi:hypothetical protein
MATFRSFFNAILNGLKHVTSKGWSMCEVWEGKVMLSPNFGPYSSAYIIGCDPWPSKIKRWQFCWEIPLGTYLQKKVSHWLKRYVVIQAFFYMAMHNPGLHNLCNLLSFVNLWRCKR